MHSVFLPSFLFSIIVFLFETSVLLKRRSFFCLFCIIWCWVERNLLPAQFQPTSLCSEIPFAETDILIYSFYYQAFKIPERTFQPSLLLTLYYFQCPVANYCFMEKNLLFSLLTLLTTEHQLCLQALTFLLLLLLHKTHCIHQSMSNTYLSIVEC